MASAYPNAPQVPAAPQPGAPGAKPAPTKMREPESLGALFRIMVEQLFRSGPRRLVIMAVTFGAVWVLHTILLAGPNGGFAPNDGSIFAGFSIAAYVLGQTLALSGRLLGGTMFWFMLSLVISSLVAGLRTPGGTFRARMGSLGTIIGSSFAQPQIAAALAGAGAGALVTGIVDNRFVALLMCIAAVLAIASGERDFSYVVMRCAYNDGRKALSKPKRRLAPSTADAFLVGFALAALVFGLVILVPGFLFVLAGVGLVVGAVVVSRNPQAAAGTVGALLALLVLGAVKSAFGDDGGFSEASGPWILSEGAAQAIAMGVPPAAAAALGTIIGALGPELGAIFVSGILPTLQSPPRGPGIGVRGGAGPGGCQGGLPNYWIDTATGRLGITDRVAGWHGIGPGVSLALAWGGPETGSGAFGRGWSFAHDGMLAETEDGILVHVGGIPALFELAPTPAGQPRTATMVGGERSTLTGYAGAWIWQDDVSGLTRRFDAIPGGAFALTSVTDLNGLSVLVQRDANGHLSTLTDAVGRTVRFQLDAAGRVTGFTMPDGRTARFEYGPAGDLVRSTDLADITAEYTYDGAGLLTAMVVGRDRKTTLFGWAQTPDGPQIASVTNAGGSVTRYELVPEGERTLRVTDPEGRATLYRASGGRTVEIVEPGGAATRYERDAAGRVTSVSGPQGTLRTVYDAAGRMASTTDPLGRTTTFAYDAAGDCVRRVMPDGSAYTFAYDAHRNPVERVTPAGRRTAMSWNERGQMVSQTLAPGGTWTYEYDAYGNCVAVAGPEGAVRRYTYDAAGLRLVAIADPAGETTSFEYDANDRVVRTVHPDGTETRSVFDCCSEIAIVDEAGVTSGVDRDPLGRPLLIKTGAAPSVGYTYDRSGRITSVAIAGTTVAWVSQDASGRTVTTTFGDGSRSELARDAAGRPVKLRTPLGYRLDVALDAAGQPVSATDPYGRVETGFDLLGNLSWLRNARGHVVELKRDADGAVTGKHVDGAPSASYEYDATGALVAAATSADGVRYEVDAATRVTAAHFGDGTAARFEYDAKGQQTAVSLPDGIEMRYAYDARGRVTSVRFGAHSVEWTYDAIGQVTSERRSNGVVTTSAWKGGALERVTHAGDAETLYDVTWGRDEFGRIVSAGGTRPIGPVAAGRAPVIRDATGRVASVGAAACTYDADGNLVARAGAYRAEHDVENRLVAITLEDGSETRYAYDAFGRRARRESAAGVRVYHRDAAGRVLFETDDAGRMLIAYVWRGPLLVAAIADGHARFYHGDANANCVAVTDGEGSVVAAYDYDAYGAVTASSGPQVRQAVRFAGLAGVTAEPGGLYAAGARFLDPAMGSFLEKDPAGWSGSPEPWQYCGGDPLNSIDASGLAGHTTSEYSNNPYGGGWRPGNSVNPTPPNPYSPPYYEPPSAPPMSSAGAGKQMSGAVNVGWGGYATYASASALWAGITGATALTPAGWAVAVGGLILGATRLWAGGKTLNDGLNGKDFGPDQSPTAETLDPTHGARSLGQKIYDDVCAFPGAIKATGGMIADGFRAIGDKLSGLKNLGDPFYAPSGD